MERQYIASIEKALKNKDVSTTLNEYQAYLQYLEKSRPVSSLDDRKAELKHFEAEYRISQFIPINKAKILTGLSASFYTIKDSNSINTLDFTDFRKDGPLFEKMLSDGEMKIDEKQFKLLLIIAFIGVPILVYFLTISGTISKVLAWIWGIVFVLLMIGNYLIDLLTKLFITRRFLTPIEEATKNNKKLGLIRLIAYKFADFATQLFWFAFLPFLMISKSKFVKKIQGSIGGHMTDKGVTNGIFHLNLVVIGFVFVIVFGLIMPLTDFDFSYHSTILHVLFVLYFLEFLALSVPLFFVPVSLVHFSKFKPKSSVLYQLVCVTLFSLAILIGALNSSESGGILTEIFETFFNFFTFKEINIPILNTHWPGFIFGGLTIGYILRISYKVPNIQKEQIISEEIVNSYIKQNEPKKAIMFLDKIEQESYPDKSIFKKLQSMAYLGNNDFEKVMEIYEDFYSQKFEKSYSHIVEHPDKDLMLAERILESSFFLYGKSQNDSRIGLLAFILLKRIRNKYGIQYLKPIMKLMVFARDQEPIDEWLTTYNPILERLSFDVKQFFVDPPIISKYFKITDHPLYKIINDRKMPHFCRMEIYYEILVHFCEKMIHASDDVKKEMEKEWEADWKNFLNQLLDTIEQTDYFVNIDRGYTIIKTFLGILNQKKGHNELKYTLNQIVLAIESKLEEMGIPASKLTHKETSGMKNKIKEFERILFRKLTMSEASSIAINRMQEGEEV